MHRPTDVKRDDELIVSAAAPEGQRRSVPTPAARTGMWDAMDADDLLGDGDDLPPLVATGAGDLFGSSGVSRSEMVYDDDFFDAAGF